MALVTFTDAKPAKIKRGIFTFWVDAHRQTTLKNLRVGGDTVALTDPTAASTVTVPVDQGSTFSITAPASTNFTITTTNFVDGQWARLIVTRAGDLGTITFNSSTGLFTATTGAGVTGFMFFRVSSTTYFVQTTIT